MSGKVPRVNPLQLRKEMLVAESELNRSQLINRWEAATEWHRTFSAGVRTVSAVASASAVLVSTVRAFRRKPGAQNGKNPSWLSLIIKGAGFVSSLWTTFRSPCRDERSQKNP
jgi:hypothetical protein